MRISDLSRETGVPVATIKFYLRERLLPSGRSTAATQAEYGQAHVDRLRLVRALTDVGRMPLATVRWVLDVVDNAAATTAEAVGAAHDSLPPLIPHGDEPPARALRLVDDLGWAVDPASASLWQLEAALAAAEEVGPPLGRDRRPPPPRRRPAPPPGGGGAGRRGRRRRRRAAARPPGGGPLGRRRHRAVRAGP